MSNDADEPTEPAVPPDGGAEAHRRRLPLPGLRHRAGDGAVGETDEGIATRLAHQWALRRDERRAQPSPVVGGPSNFSRAEVPWGVDLAAAWAWRFLVIAAAAYLVLWLVAFFAVVTIPIAVALLISALVIPVVDGLDRVMPRGLAALLVVLAGIAFVVALLTFAGQQVANGATDLADQTVQGLDEVKDWLKNGPLNASDSQINEYIDRIQKAITDRTQEGVGLSSITEVGTAVGHVLAGFFIVLFSTYFFLADGERIWAWLVRIAPRAAREHADSSGRVAWISLTQFVRATVIVAATDAAGVMIGAAVLGVPFVLAIGVLVFLGAFVPMVGATVAGTVAVLVALVDQGPVTALLMLAVVIGVQQLEGHVLQPFLMGRWVSLHPLGVIVAIGCGVLVAGIAGALIAVPLAASLNAVVQHLAANTSVGDDDPVEELAEDYEEMGSTVEVPREESHDE
ncbi:AI-2E family transporter [Nocardioides sp. MAH-18]|uniref:AI-2E family transporter n=1 Tax=Nocardioides agri TaxID=2682843 RepID=A0A6L6XP09_9ACTN|nr:AI-2E family transporter [Nocardioides sp. CGMCC 1.13656]MBA2954147.1 AI-2E family transporter [Nocardioides sp. CGMCC 1.13656]MVQ49009.1 AI-2E family transporter [Nocardioides sp. MAH-18]